MDDRVGSPPPPASAMVLRDMARTHGTPEELRLAELSERVAALDRRVTDLGRHL
jgi:hypothetical protein